MWLRTCCLLFPLAACRPATDAAPKESGLGIGGTSGIDCTEIGCADGYSGEFSPPFTTAGDYEFTLSLDGDPSSCQGSLPIRDDFTCEGVLQLTVSGSALPDDEHSLPGFFVYRTDFSELVLTVTRDGVEAARWEERPEWVVSQPNGPDCEPTCTQAASTFRRP